MQAESLLFTHSNDDGDVSESIEVGGSCTPTIQDGPEFVEGLTL